MSRGTPGKPDIRDRSATAAAAGYEKFGVTSNWIVDPDPVRPEVTVFDL